MSAIKQKIFEAARGVRAYLGLSGGSQTQELRQVERLLEKRTRELERARRQLADERRELERLWAGSQGSAVGSVNTKNIIWIFGSGRSGSTWLSSMMGELSGQSLWGEPWVGTLFGNFYYGQGEKRRQSPEFILGHHRESWLGSLRNFVLDAAAVTFPNLKEDNYLVIKEPNGSIGAPLLMEALPESSMILLARNPRDVVASNLDARREGGWNYERNKDSVRRQGKEPPRKDSVAWAERLAKGYVRQLGKAKLAYDAHKGHKVLVRYEELRVNTFGEMKRIYSTLGVPVDEEELKRVVEKHSWENIPEEEKGEGKFYRKASPGSWKEDLTEEQAEMVERVTAPLLKELYPEKV